MKTDKKYLVIIPASDALGRKSKRAPFIYGFDKKKDQKAFFKYLIGLKPGSQAIMSVHKVETIA